MGLQISVFLLFILFTAGHSLRCYNCTSDTGSCENQKVISCPSGSSHCASSTTVTQVGDITSKVKIKGCDPDCQSGSMNLGYAKISHYCCNTDLCNAQDAPDPSNVPNGKTCYSCDGQNCTNILKCSGTEDRCVKVTAASGGQTVVLKGCVSKSACDTTVSDPNVQSFSCCEGNLCNGAPSVSQSSTVNSAPSVSQSFLFLCCSLLSYFLLH